MARRPCLSSVPLWWVDTSMVAVPYIASKTCCQSNVWMGDGELKHETRCNHGRGWGGWGGRATPGGTLRYSSATTGRALCGEQEEATRVPATDKYQRGRGFKGVGSTAPPPHYPATARLSWMGQKCYKKTCDKLTCAEATIGHFGTFRNFCQGGQRGSAGGGGGGLPLDNVTPHKV